MPSSAEGDNVSRSGSGLPTSAHQQIAKYELPIPRGPAVQPGRPPAAPSAPSQYPSEPSVSPRPVSPKVRTLEWTDGASRLSVCGDAAASAFVKVQNARQQLAKPRLTTERPLLSPATELLCKCTLQPWQCSHSATPLSWRKQSLVMLQSASGVDLTRTVDSGGSELNLLTLELNPLEMKTDQGESLVIRSVAHRPSPTAYRTAWSLAYLHLLSHIGHHNNKTPEAIIHPSTRLRHFFPNAERHPAREGASLADPQRLLHACLSVAPAATEWKITRFQPSHAVIFTINAEAALQGERPKFECIAGWARWSALVATLEGIRMKQPMAQTYLMSLETRVPVYVIDSSGLTRANLTRLSTALNLADIEFSSNPPPASHLQFFLSTQALNEIRSRPFTLCDRLWTLHNALVDCGAEAQDKPELMESQTLASLLYKYIKSSQDWLELTIWLEAEAAQLSGSAWVANPLVIPAPLSGSISDVRVASELLISFMLSLAWPVSSIQLMSLSLGDLQRTFGSEFPFGSLELSRRPRTGIGFWDDLLIHHLPYQIQCCYSLADLFGLTRSFEIFFMPRCGLHNALIQSLDWSQVQDVSLLNHFARNDSSAQFVCRIVEHTALQGITSSSNPTSFEHLSAFICIYNLHFCMELEEKALRGFGQLFESKTVASSGPDAPIEASADHTLPPQLKGDPVCIYGTGASRILHLVRGLVLFAYLTCDNPYQIQEMAHRQQQHIAPLLHQHPSGPSPPMMLVCPHPGRPVLTPFAALFSMKGEGKKGLEEHFELLLGALAELLFRECLAGLAREDLFGQVQQTLVSPTEALRQRAAKHEALGHKSPNLMELLKGGGLLVQTFIRACWAAQRNVPPRTFAVFPELGDRDGHLSRSPVSDLLSARAAVYEHIMRYLTMHGLDNAAVSLYAFVPRILGPLFRLKDTAEVSILAEGVICGDAIWRVLQCRPKTLPSPPVMALSAPAVDPLHDRSPPMPEVLRSRGMKEQEYYSRICRQRFEHIAAAMAMADKKGPVSASEVEFARLVKQELSATAAAAALSGQSITPSTMGAMSSTVMSGDNTRRGSIASIGTSSANSALPPSSTVPTTTAASAGTTAVPVPASATSDQRHGLMTAEWFEDRRSEVRKFLLGLYKLMKSEDSKAGGVSVRLDFRGRSVEEARGMAHPLSDLATDSTHTQGSLVDVPYQLDIENPRVFPWAETALLAIQAEVERTLRAHLSEGFKQLLNVQEQGHSVVASARPAVICALWQTLVHLPPHLDVLYPLALRWNHVRAVICAWLWGELRDRLDNFWHVLCRKNLNRDDNLPGLRWSIRCLPAEQDPNGLANMPDLTAQRLLHLLTSPKTMDRICSALYRFQCSGMATANAALGNLDVLQISPEHLERIFVTTENSLRDTFKSLWSRLPPNSPIENALHDPEIAAAGFLKRYAPLILGSLDELDRHDDTIVPEAGEPPSKRRRREYVEEAEEGAGATGVERGGRRRQMDGVPAGLALASMSVQNLRKELRQRSSVGRRRKHRQDEEEEDEGGMGETATSAPRERWTQRGTMRSSNANWLKCLPVTLIKRLERSIPEEFIVNKFEESYFRQRAEIRHRSSEEQIEEMEPPLNGSFPRIPQWMENEPMWKLWAPLVKRPEGFTSPFPRDEDYLGDYGIRRKLSLFGPRPPPADMSERDWELVKTVLEFLHQRGIDTLYSSTTQSIFHVTVNDRHGGLEWRKDLDESADTGSFPSSPRPKVSSKMVGGLNLRRYLDGWAADADPFLPKPINNIFPRRHPSQQHFSETPVAPPSDIKELNDQIVL